MAVYHLKLFLLLVVFLTTTILFSQQYTNPNNQDEELGKVAWLRDYDVAIALSKKQNKPIFILFQEVPGCLTCRNYGNNVLSNPLMVETIENEFIPLAIFNNKGGDDAKILKKYKEPSWNNPVVRIIDAEGKNLIKRVSSNYFAKFLYDAMIFALNIYGNQIPSYTKLLGIELSSTKVKKRTYQMYCFWTGEKELGNQNGVLTTKAGFQQGAEVVQLSYNPNVISKQKLDKIAIARKMKPVHNGNFKWSEKDEDYYIQHSKYASIPLSSLQRTKINSALGNGKNPEIYLSPSQIKWLKNTDKNIRFDKNFKTEWYKLASKK